MAYSYMDMRACDAIEKWVKTKNKSWDQIRSLSWLTTDLKEYLEENSEILFDKEYTPEEWVNLVEIKKREMEEEESLENETLPVTLSRDRKGFRNLSRRNGSAWMKYENRLKRKGYSQEAIKSIRLSVREALQDLDFQTEPGNPTKGMVVGNVQSGKTGNMAGLMAAAADAGFNFFIVLTGTIENLRQQTEDRLRQDLESGNLHWCFLNDLRSTKSRGGSKLSSLNLSPESTERYVYVCLKNSKILNNLTSWLRSAPGKLHQMKILIIDDEADQASVNTGRSKQTETAIYKWIKKIAFDAGDGHDEAQPLSVNYIGYTATPYGNLLNDRSDDSLYPSSFIQTLGVSPEYFGPQQIFGVEENEYFDPESETQSKSKVYEGLEIIRDVPDNDVKDIEAIHRDPWAKQIPNTLRNCLVWFLCGTAALRASDIFEPSRPISCLIHTSMKKESHDHLAEAVRNWLDGMMSRPDELIDECRRVWQEETKRFSREDFLAGFSSYGRKEQVEEYPEFDSFLPQLKELISCRVSSIEHNVDGNLEFFSGIHLCVDNSDPNPDPNEHRRLVYPEPEQIKGKNPAFIVIGGNTLARGLTIEGLISTYFLRTTRQADTLMQMGRWFGYRKNYEMIPRIWMTEKTKRNYVFLSSLDQELRNEIRKLRIRDLSPADYSPGVMNTTGLKPTGRSKMTSAQICNVSLWGSTKQRVLYSALKDNQVREMNLFNAFIRDLGDPVSIRNFKNKDDQGRNVSYVWKNVEWDEISRFLTEMGQISESPFFTTMNRMCDWIQKNHTDHSELNSWDVILSGNTKGNRSVETPAGSLYPVSRSARGKDDQIIDLGSLLTSKDMLLDIDLDLNPGAEQLINNFENSLTALSDLRRKTDVADRPVLLLYVIDRDSKAVIRTVKAESDENSKKRKGPERQDLKTDEDLIGLTVLIPEIDRTSHREGYWQIPSRQLSDIDNRTDVEDQE